MGQKLMSSAKTIVAAAAANDNNGSGPAGLPNGADPTRAGRNRSGHAIDEPGRSDLMQNRK